MNDSTQRIEISYKTIVFTVAFLLVLYFLFEIRDILFLLFLSIVAASGLRPSVDKLEDMRVPRIISILIVYIVVFGALFLMLSYIIPVFANQSTRLVDRLTYFFSFLSPYIDVSSSSITGNVVPFGADIFKATVGIFSGIVNAFSFFVFTFYLLLERRHVRVLLKNFLGEEMKEKVVSVFLKIEHKLGAWVQGQLSLMIIVGVLTFVGLWVLGIEFALPLAIIAGVLEIVPIIGPIVAAVPAVIIALLTSPVLALGTVVLYFLVQQLENHLIVPFVMKRAVGIPPMVSIVAILIGGKLFGFIGILLAIPFFLCVQIMVQEFVSMREGKSSVKQ